MNCQSGCGYAPSLCCPCWRTRSHKTGVLSPIGLGSIPISPEHRPFSRSPGWVFCFLLEFVQLWRAAENPILKPMCFSHSKLVLLSSNCFLKLVTYVLFVLADGCASPGLFPWQTVSQHPQGPPGTPPLRADFQWLVLPLGHLFRKSREPCLSACCCRPPSSIVCFI